MEERAGFFLKNSDAKEMHEASSQERKGLVYSLGCGDRDLDWESGGSADSASDFRAQGLL